MSYSDLFSGEEVWLGPDCDPGWISPYLKVLHTVEMEVQPELDILDSPITNLVVDRDARLEAVWGIEKGWSAMAVMLQNIGELLSICDPEAHGVNLLEVEQLVVRNDDWTIKSTHYRVFWKGAEVDGI
jgi:hypothetical protein